MIRNIIIAAAVLAAPAVAHAQSDEIHLRCDGNLSYSQAQTVTTTGSIYGSYGYSNGYTATTVNVPTQRGITIMVDVQGGDIYMKSAMPFNVIHPVVGPDAFSGQIRQNMLDKPSFRIDRLSGAMNISGTGFVFNGQCRKVAAQQQQF